MKIESKNYLKIAKFLLKIEKQAYRKIKGLKFDINDKSSNDIVTSCDLYVEKFLLNKIHSVYPNTKIVSEESFSSVKAEGTFFTIDPIDGTKNFANGNENWGIQIAYIENDIPIASAIFMPYFGGFYAAKDCGAFKNGKRFFTTARELKYSLAEINYINLSLLNKKQYRNITQSVLDIRDCGASCKIYTSLAQGQLGVKLDIGHCNPWDVLPGIILTNEAKCETKQFDDFTITATSKENLDEIIGKLKS